VEPGAGTAIQDTRAGSHRAWRVYDAIPDLVSCAVAGLSTVAVLLLLCQAFRPALMIPLGVLGAVVGAVVCGVERRVLPRSERWAIATALVLVLGFALINMRYAGQWIITDRDPGTYAVAGQWLVHHSSVLVHPGTDVFGAQGLITQSPGFWPPPSGSAEVLQPQGLHLLPALLAIGGWGGGTVGLLATNAFIGGLALLAFFGAARRIAGGWWAVLATAILGLSLPMLAFSRVTYTEPITLLFIFAGVSLLWRAFERRRSLDFALAGFVFGCSMLARIDGFAALLALIPVAGGLLLCTAPLERGKALRNVAWLVVGIAIPTTMSFLDARWFTTGYLDQRMTEIRPLAYVGIAVTAVVAVLVAIEWRTGTLGRLYTRRGRMLAFTLSGLVVVAFAVLASRPLWMEAHQLEPQFSGAIEVLQKAAGQALDGSRHYDEQSVNWLSWYYGWVTIALGVAGLTGFVWLLVRRGDLRYLGIASLAIGMSVLYLSVPAIFPDQIWAMRRFLPVVIPGLLCAAVAVLAWLWATKKAWWRISAACLGAIAVAFPIAIGHGLYSVREGVPQRYEVESVCKAVGPNGAILMTDPGLAGTYLSTMHAFCGVPVAGLANPSVEDLAVMRKSLAGHGRELFVLATNPSQIPLASPGDPTPLTSVSAQFWQKRIDRVPKYPTYVDRTMYLGTVDANGYVTLAP
jgi:hypothetical protein